MFKTLIASAACIAALSASAQAATVSWSATLDQAQEVPAAILVPGAGGSASGTLDTITGLLDWTISWSGLSGAALGAHFHAAAAPGATAPVVVNVGIISGLASPTSGEVALPEIGVKNFLAGLYYINVHTALNPTGEIRGQVELDVAPVPLPAAAPLLLGGLVLLGGLRARRARRASLTA